MKANRKFLQADEAVSPVIAVILMVAITVVLAATVFVLVSDIGSNTNQAAPQIGWSESESDDSISVTSAPTQLFWDDFEIKASAVADYRRDGGAWNPLAANTYEAVGASTDEVEGGNLFEFCGGTGGAGVDLTDLMISVRHITSNSLVEEHTFSTVAACA